MDDLPRSILRALLVQYGHTLCSEPARCEALLRDHCGQHKKEIFVLIQALKHRVADDLLKASTGTPYALILTRAKQRLENRLAMTPEAAHWAVDSWAMALGFLTENQSVNQHNNLNPLNSTQLINKRYQDTGDGSVLDIQTSLQWMRCALGQAWKDGDCGGPAQGYRWETARKAARVFNRLGGYAGHCDWRVPTKSELLTLVVLPANNISNPTIDSAVFPHTPAAAFWTSSLFSSHSDLVWIVRFDQGQATQEDRNGVCCVRLVRDSRGNNI